MAVLEKKGDVSLCENYRGISIGETLSKVHTTILKHRLVALCENIAPECCNGFRKGRGRSDSIYVLMEVLRMRKRKGLNSWVTFFDVQKHFDRLPQRFMWKSMQKRGVAEKMIRVVRSTLEGATCVLHVDEKTREVNMNDCSGQGTSLEDQPWPPSDTFAILPILAFWVARWCDSATAVLHEEGTFPVFVNSFADDASAVNGEREGATETGGILHRASAISVWVFTWAARKTPNPNRWCICALLRRGTRSTMPRPITTS
jgi:hypothetical protein